FGFSARLGGGGFPTNMYFYYAGNSGFWWSASENTSGGGGKHAYNQFMSSSDNSALGGITHENGLKQNLLSVRCVKD
ncbi:MAG: fibrobacter succinogenes major paralogous domain-containing protein, partial [Fibromonadales bacterium]|nr:fibrobacter succinogenes major paralogous domain-containing protein [Fibromonadales bacterium]